ncbi:MAG: hypothetical protein P9F19_10170 [Candidatus Contendobacter sp.]|nr:hypothetical protein [Candidatus Contendobacter sp.]MDG4557737.1 hypothetical protein [Candidatus Contendobacter sp.]
MHEQVAVLERITHCLAQAGISVPQLGWAYLRHWAERLGILSLLEEARS